MSGSCVSASHVPHLFVQTSGISPWGLPGPEGTRPRPSYWDALVSLWDLRFPWRKPGSERGLFKCLFSFKCFW